MSKALVKTSAKQKRDRGRDSQPSPRPRLNSQLHGKTFPQAPSPSFSSKSKCHFRGVIFRCVPGVLPLHKIRGFLLPLGLFRGAFKENDTCFPLFLLCMQPMNKCHFRTGTWGGSQGTPWCSRNTPAKNDTLKMTLGRARRFLVFWGEFLAFWSCKEFLAFWSVLPVFPKDFVGSLGKENPWFFGSFPCIFRKSKDKKIRSFV